MNPPPRPMDNTADYNPYTAQASTGRALIPTAHTHPKTDSSASFASHQTHTDPDRSDPLSAFFDQREQRSRASVRTPLVLGAHRIAMAADRCRQLEQLLADTRLNLLNLNPRADPGRVSSLEDRAIRLATELHSERLSVWKDLQPLAEKITDASLDSMRRSWLELLASSDGQPPGPPAPHPSRDAEHPGGGYP